MARRREEVWVHADRKAKRLAKRRWDIQTTKERKGARVYRKDRQWASRVSRQGVSELASCFSCGRMTCVCICDDEGASDD